MTAPGGAGGFLEFFILEAGDYVEQLDGVLLGGGRAEGGPDSDALQRIARALRGTATMAKIPSFAELAGGVERVGRALQEGAVQWSPAIGGALTAAVDDLKILLHATRTWSEDDANRARTRAAELSRLAPRRTAATASGAATPAVSGTPTAFLGTEASNIAAGLELLTTRAGDADTATNVLHRVRALRGVAGVKEIGPLAEALEATEDAARGLETGEEQLSNESRQLLEAAAGYLRTLAAALRGNGEVNAPSSSRDAFAAALETWAGRDNDRERVVPIATLFYPGGEPGGGLVEASPNPPTSPGERFRLELVSQGEHLKQVIDAARHAADTSSSVRVRRDLKRSLGALRAASESFGELEIGEFIGGHLPAAENADASGLASLDDLAALLTDPRLKGERLTVRLRAIARGKPEAPAPIAATPAVADFQPPVSVAAADRGEPPPIRRQVSVLDQTISTLEAYSATPSLEPTPIVEEKLVPIESLLYRGPAALERAIELRDLMRAGTRDRATLDELFDLLDLVRAE